MACREYTEQQKKSMALKTLQAHEAGEPCAEEVIVYTAILSGISRAAVVDRLKAYVGDGVCESGELLPRDETAEQTKQRVQRSWLRRWGG